MARIRALKPGFFKNHALFVAEKESGLPLRLAYEGLWCVADREGRFKWKPHEIKTDVLPYDDVDMSAVLDALVKYRFIFKYKVAGEEYGFIPTFLEHQHVNKNEAPSTIPAPPKNSNARAKPVNAPKATVAAPSAYHEELVSGVREQEQEQEGKEKKQVVRAERAASKTSLPEDFPDNEAIRRAQGFWTEKGRPDLAHSVRDEAEHFRDHHLKLGNRFASWPAAWRTWTRTALKLNRPLNGRVSAHDKGTEGAALAIAALERGDGTGHRDRAGEVIAGPGLLPSRHGREEMAGPVSDLLRRSQGAER